MKIEEKRKFKTDLYMWGKNHFGQLGIPEAQMEDSDDRPLKENMKRNFDPNQYHAPMDASFDIPIQHVSSGEEHTAILTKDGEIWMIGSN